MNTINVSRKTVISVCEKALSNILAIRKKQEENTVNKFWKEYNDDVEAHNRSFWGWFGKKEPLENYEKACEKYEKACEKMDEFARKLGYLNGGYKFIRTSFYAENLKTDIEIILAACKTEQVDDMVSLDIGDWGKVCQEVCSEVK